MFSLHGINEDQEKKESTIESSPTIFNGRYILRELALFSEAHCPKVFPLILLVTFGKILIPYLVRYFTYGTFFGFGWDGTLYSVLEFLSMFLISLPNYIFVFAGLIDFYRRLLMIKGCSALLNPFKSNVGLKYRVLPSLNPCCKESIHSWLMMRLCVMDFGRKYLNRIFIYCSVFFGGYLFFVIVLLLSFFDLLSFKLSLIA